MIIFQLYPDRLAFITFQISELKSKQALYERMNARTFRASAPMSPIPMSISQSLSTGQIISSLKDPNLGVGTISDC
jgi:hypothetical protein